MGKLILFDKEKAAFALNKRYAVTAGLDKQFDFIEIDKFKVQLIAIRWGKQMW